mgnify:CR=1 FL=1
MSSLPFYNLFISSANPRATRGILVRAPHNAPSFWFSHFLPHHFTPHPTFPQFVLLVFYHPTFHACLFSFRSYPCFIIKESGKILTIQIFPFFYFSLVFYFFVLEKYLPSSFLSEFSIFLVSPRISKIKNLLLAAYSASSKVTNLLA